MTLVKDRPEGLASVTADEILASHFTLIAQPGSIDPVKIAGLDGWTSKNPHPVLSLIRWTTDNPDTAAAGLEQIVGRFREMGRGFDWMTGPRCAQNGLLPLLEGHGFIAPPLEVAAMACPITPHAEPTPPKDIRIWQVSDAHDGRFWNIMARGFDVPDDVAAVMHHAYMAPSPLQRSELYAAALGDSEEPVAVGYLSYIGDGPSVLLRVSSTLEDSRGHGAYRALVTRRLYEAAQQGRTQAFVHAYSPGSKHILTELGFATIGTLQLHRWRP